MGLKKRKKQLEKRIKGLKKQIEKHIDFIKHKKGRLDTTKNYWKKEVKRFEKKKEVSEEKLKSLKEK